ncbi:peptide MFS transporter [Cellulomonas chengniuliangii]|uniref:Peptide MFS transporter n=1 Tax=Cellulomonas chengniuliangii TaxID=2968084 RepID=A0ABY5L3P0_9CELL|nr:peptide MFS transporter [Cellulomonas chengniuliangii]MCC2309857.1 peptide MFS transporter [Cellulomonas chengniuliangii]MCC2318116.1 peptide MFS transporter [Cellulomonas chengniuliangii]UUI76301.1 peptide MFS transporter [Cellulomonas chengniuliangii]
MSSSSQAEPRPDHQPPVPRDRAFFGHPLGLFTLFNTELWERFSYYGMRAILLYYLTAATRDGGLGISSGTGAALVAIYGTAVYLLSVVGGWLADRVIGARRATLYGGIVIAAGHVLLTIPTAAFSFAGIACVAMGTGLLKPNVSTMVGELYDREDSRRSSAFSIFYMGINIGSLAAPFVVGAARAWGGFHAGFAVAAVGMAIALAFFVVGRPLLGKAGDQPGNPLTRSDGPSVARTGLLVAAAVAVAVLVASWTSDATGIGTMIDALSYLAFAAPIVYFVVMFRSPRVTSHERSRLAAYVPLFITAMVFWMIFEQAASTMAAYAENRTDLSLLGFTLAPEVFQSVNPAGIVLLSPVFAWLWLKTNNRPPTAVKFAIGLTLAAASFLFLSGASALAGDAKTPAWVLVATYVLQTLGELCLSPIGLAATTLLAPEAFRSQAMALWFLAPAAGNAITAQVLTATTGVSETAYFGWIGAIALIPAVAMFALSPWVTRHIKAGAESTREAAIQE